MKRILNYIVVTLLLLSFIPCWLVVLSYKPPPEKHIGIVADTTDYWHLWTMAIIQVESGGDDNAVGRTNDYGCLQITPILIKEVNRIQSERKYTINDAKNRATSIEIFNLIQEYYNPEQDLHLALKVWNPKAPISYHKKVEEEYSKLIINNGQTTNTNN